MSAVWEDPRVRAGMSRQLATRRERIEAGERHCGWKVAFNTPASFVRLDIEGSLIGFFTDRNQLGDGATIDLANWIKPVLEPEIVAYLSREVSAGATTQEVAGAIAAVGVGFEIADLDADLLDDVSAVLAGDIFHRFMVLPGGRVDLKDASESAGIVSAGNGVEHEVVSPSAEEIVGIVKYTADYLRAWGERLAPGDIVMTGSVIPPIEIGPGQRWSFEVSCLGQVSAEFSA
jgi:2-keto-4-pentenoate hydratase